MSCFAVCKSLAPPVHRRPKAKSGPLGGTGTLGVGYFAGKHRGHYDKAINQKDSREMKINQSLLMT